MAEPSRRIAVDPRPIEEGHSPSSQEAATFSREFSLCYQKDALAREVGFASLASLDGDAAEEIIFHNPTDVGDISYNFRVGSTMRENEIRDCIREYAIPDSFKCRKARNG